MAWTDKPGKCEICGKDIILKSSRHKRCKECADVMNRIHRIRNRKEQAQREREHRAERTGERKKRETVCKMTELCMYGNRGKCEYMTVTGHSRLFAGYPIRGGKCDAYKRGKFVGGSPGSVRPFTTPPGKILEV